MQYQVQDGLYHQGDHNQDCWRDPRQQLRDAVSDRHQDNGHTERDEQFAFKAPRNVRYGEQRGIKEGEQGLPAQVSTGLCPNHFHPAEFDSLILKTLLKRLLHLLTDVLSFAWVLRYANEHFALITVMLHDALAQAERIQGFAHASQVCRLAEAQL